MGKLVLNARHKLLCGDATDKESLNRLMDGEQADLVLTDPPYNVAVNNESKESLEKRNRRSDGLVIENDKMSEDDFISFLNKVFTGYFSKMRMASS